MNLLATEQDRNLKSSDSVNIENAICKFSFALTAVSLVCCQTFLSDSYPPKSILISGGVPAAARSLGESLGLKTRPSNSTFEISNIQTSIKYSIPQEICINQDANEYHCP
ncbi:hypothetical protein [Microcoleus sp. F4-D5]|uniref:hypothetical protein n=1 Tax=Microcoleus sp. F4-D5 TaxID=2818760 RepID=UPI002FCF7ECE